LLHSVPTRRSSDLMRIIQAAARSLKLNAERVFSNLEHYGNTSAASIPIALCEAIQAGRIHPNDHLVLVGFGAGLTWGAAVIQWGVPLPVTPTAWWLRIFYWLYYRWARARSWSARQRRRVEDLLPTNGNGHDRNGHRRNGASPGPHTDQPLPAQPERESAPEEKPEPVAEADGQQN
jgi:3-oxoacyl-[acyl-carrier-protein] synthase-3